MYLPFQKTGTGVMTKRSWITSITPVNVPSGLTLRVMRTDRDFSFTTTDGLLNAANDSIALGTTNTFASGVIDGNAPFVASEVPSSSWASMEVDVTWAAGSTHSESNNPQGWQFRLSDIGCAGYNQKMTMRYTTGPNRISFEQYGNTSVSRTEPTTTTSEGQAFAFERGDLAIDGVLLSTSANQAVVRLDTITWGGVPVCSTGTYTLNAE